MLSGGEPLLFLLVFGFVFLIYNAFSKPFTLKLFVSFIFGFMLIYIPLFFILGINLMFLETQIIEKITNSFMSLINLNSDAIKHLFYRFTVVLMIVSIFNLLFLDVSCLIFKNDVLQVFLPFLFIFSISYFAVLQLDMIVAKRIIISKWIVRLMIYLPIILFVAFWSYNFLFENNINEQVLSFPIGIGVKRLLFGPILLIFSGIPLYKRKFEGAFYLFIVLSIFGSFLVIL